MIFEITYSFLFFLVVFLSLRYVKLFQVEGLKRWDLAFAFGIKSLAALFFIYIYTWHYGSGYLFFDSGMFITDAKILNEVFYKSPLDFFKLITGYGETDELVAKHISKTLMWSRPYSIITNDTKNIVRINSMIHFFSFNSVYIHFVIFNLFALSGLKNIYLFFKKYINLNPRVFFFSIILLPSLLFWSSSVLKEPMLIFAIGLFLKAISLQNKKLITKIIFIVVSVYILLNFKAYVLLSILLPLLFILISKFIIVKKSIVFSLFIYLGLIVVMFFSFPKQRQKMVDNISVKQFDFNNIGKGGIYFKADFINQYNRYCIQSEDYQNIKIENDSLIILKKTRVYTFNGKTKAKIKKFFLPADSTKKIKISSIWRQSSSYIKTTLIFSSTKQLILNIPEALVNSLFRPFLNDLGTKFKYFTFFETLGLFGFLLFAIFKRKKLNRNEKIMVISLIVFILCLSLIIGWTTPILGALVRYRIPVYLAILILAFIIYKPSEKWKTKKNIS